MASTPKKKKNLTAATPKEGSEARERKVEKAQEAGNPVALRIFAVVLWLTAIGFEIVALLIFNGTIAWTFLPTIALVIIALVLDLGCVIGGSILWKKANRIDPASEKNKFLFWLWNNMGLIACTLAFVPFIILALTDKKADKKSKAIVTVVAVIMLLIAGLVSYEWDPVSAEDLEAARNAISGDVYWVRTGDTYHTSMDCSYLNNTEDLTYGTVDDAFDHGHVDLCSRCARRDGIEGVRTTDFDPFTETAPADSEPLETTVPAE